MADSLRELVGSMHIHSTYSDGSLDIPAICDQAKAAGLDYILMTDHNTLQPKHDGYEGWNDSLLVIIGCELNDERNRNHYLVFDYDGEIPKCDNALKFVHRVKEAGGLGIIAHPDEDGGYVSSLLDAYPWTEWRTQEFNGMELWNQMTEWKEGLTKRNKYWRLIHPRRYIRGPKKSTMARWDYLTQQRKVVGTGGPDLHAYWYKLFRLIPVCIYPYKVSFKLIRMHILIPEVPEISSGKRTPESFEVIKNELFSGLAYGRAFISNYFLGDARGFRIQVDTPSGTVGMGDQIDWHGEKCRMKVSCPYESVIKLIRNGKLYNAAESREASFDIPEEGVYRVEVHRNNKCWIISNPVWLQSWPKNEDKSS